MPNAQLKLFAVTDTRQLVSGETDPAPFTLPTFYQSDVVPIKLELLSTYGGIRTPFQVVESQYAIRVGIVTPNPASQMVHAIGTLAWDGVSAYLGNLSLATSEVISLLNGQTSVASTLEIEATGSGAVNTWQAGIVIKADGLKTGTPIAVSGTDNFYTSAESDIRYLQKNGANTIAATTSVSRSDSATFNFGDKLSNGAWVNNGTTVATRTYVETLALAGGTLAGRLYTGGLEPVGPNEVPGRNWVLANGGAVVAGAGITKTGQTVAADFGVTPGKVARGEHWHYTGTLVESGAGLYHTSARVLNTIVSTVDVSGTVAAVNAYDSLVGAVGKLEATKVAKTGAVMTGALTTTEFTQTASTAALAEGGARFDADSAQFVEFTGGLEGYRPQVLALGLSDKTVSGTTSETTLVPTSIKGSCTLPGGYLITGRGLRLTLQGYVSTKAAPVGNLTLRVKLGATTISSLTFQPTDDVSNSFIRFESMLACRSSGGTGTVRGQAMAWQADTGIYGAVATSATILDTYASKELTVTAQWGTASVANTITITDFVFESL